MSLVAVGRISGCFGVKGYLKVHSITHRQERFEEMQEVRLGVSEKETEVHVIEGVMFTRDEARVKLKGINDRTSEEGMVGKFLFVREEEMLTTEKGSYFVHDVIGCDVRSTDGRLIGVVEDVYKFPAQDVWAIRAGPKLHLVPAVKEFVKSVDTVHRNIVIRVIEGLLDDSF